MGRTGSKQKKEDVLRVLFFGAEKVRVTDSLQHGPGQSRGAWKAYIQLYPAHPVRRSKLGHWSNGTTVWGLSFSLWAHLFIHSSSSQSTYKSTYYVPGTKKRLAHILKDPISNTLYSQMIQLGKWPPSLLSFFISPLDHRDASSSKMLGGIPKQAWQSFENEKNKKQTV